LKNPKDSKHHLKWVTPGRQDHELIYHCGGVVLKRGLKIGTKNITATFTNENSATTSTNLGGESHIGTNYRWKLIETSSQRGNGGLEGADVRSPGRPANTELKRLLEELVKIGRCSRLTPAKKELTHQGIAYGRD